MKNKVKTITRRCLLLMLAAALLGVFLWWNNRALTVTEIALDAPVKRSVRILHLSDLHGAWFGAGQNEISARAASLAPDVIVITGDFIDKRCDEQAAVSLIEAMAELAPVCCVTGNHEALEQRAGTGAYERLIEAIEETENAHLLRGETVALTDEITLTGADDIPFAGGLSAYPRYIGELGAAADGRYRILLAHRPEMFDCYAEAGFDLTLSGHAHGGQIRLPLIGGLYAPGQGVLPEYTSGVYEVENGMRMYVSRGLGNSVFPFRIFNRPEMTLIEVGVQGAAGD